MQRTPTPNVVVSGGIYVLQLCTSKDNSLCVWRETFFVLDHLLHPKHSCATIHIQSDYLAGQSLDNYLKRILIIRRGLFLFII